MIVRWFVAAAVLAGVVYLLGDPTDPWLWACILAFLGLALLGISTMDPDLAKERFSPPNSGADRLALATVRLVALAHVLVGLVDRGQGWSRMPTPLRAVGLAGFTLCFLLILHAMRSNRFFSGVVRIQTDRGHRVVDRGPYAVIRHPGYAGMILLVPFSGLALGSWLAVAIALAYSALILRRVFFEDRFLRQYLPGYDAYARRVPSRLIPHVW